jgi:predicted extracellular nuclease
MELENDGYETDNAIQDLVNGLNAATAPDTYNFIDPGLERLPDANALVSTFSSAPLLLISPAPLPK